MGIRHIDYDKCTRCGRCVTYCPQDVLRPDGERRPVITYLQDCQSCFLCEKYCPAGAIAVPGGKSDGKTGNMLRNAVLPARAAFRHAAGRQYPRLPAVRKPGQHMEDIPMIANMPASTFLLYIGAFLAQFVFVIAYGIWWCLQGRGASDKNKRN